MKASDYIIDYLYHRGVTHIFEIIGGMITELIDSADRHGKIKLISVHHEQSAAFAAYSMGRSTGVPGVAMATSGPGAINLLTGVGSCYFDSVPAIFLTGQVNIHEQKNGRNIRQLGFQETDVVSMARPITKAAWMIRDPQDVPQAIEEAFLITLSDRPGPVLLDIPMDVQRKSISPQVYTNQQVVLEEYFEDLSAINTILQALMEAKNPLILVGGGLKSAQVIDDFREFANIVKVPVVHSLMAVDVLPNDNKLRVGMIGTYGNRWANMAIGKSDMILVLGSRLDIRQTGADVEFFQKGRNIIHVDCEKDEINNRIKGCYSIVANLKAFIPLLLRASTELQFPQRGEWINDIEQMRKEWPDVDEIKQKTGINPIKFMHTLSKASGEAVGYVVDTGNHQMWAAQSLEINEKQQFISSGGMGAMGFSLPAAIGLSFTYPDQAVIQITGDGGMQINIQELETISHHKLPIKMVVINNSSLGMVRQFQQSYYNERYASSIKGYSAPDFEKVAKAYGIGSLTIDNETQIQDGISKLWENPHKPFLLQVRIDPTINAYPKIAFGHPITGMEPDIEPFDLGES